MTVFLIIVSLYGGVERVPIGNVGPLKQISIKYSRSSEWVA